MNDTLAAAESLSPQFGFKDLVHGNLHLLLVPWTPRDGPWRLLYSPSSWALGGLAVLSCVISAIHRNDGSLFVYDPSVIMNERSFGENP